MHRVQLHYTLGRGTGDGRTVHNPLPALLQAVAREGSISAAARALGLSYRHVWGALKRWEADLGHELLLWDKGQAAQLSAFGRKLLWAEQQAQARLAPQIEALQADLERAFAMAFDEHAHVLTLYASHDDALPLLRTHAAAAERDQPVHLDMRFCGSVDAIRALNEGRCTLAGFHAPEAPARHSLAARAYRPLLRPGQHKVIGFARRWQGLIVAPGNPMGLQGMADVAARGARFVNRPPGSGTRVLLDSLLHEAGLPAEAVAGHAEQEPSHDAVAQRVASGSADVGLGIAAAAARRGLGFVPLVRECYHLVCLRSELESPATRALRQVLASPDWQQALGALTGYEPWHSGTVLALRNVLPWWDFAAPKPRLQP